MGKSRPWNTDHALEAVCRASSSAIIALDPRGTVHLWNSSAERIFGWRQEEVIGQPVKIIPPEKREGLHGYLKRTMEGEAIQGVKVQKLRKDGTQVDLRLFAAPLRDDQGNINGCLGIFREISAERVKLQRANRTLKIINLCNRAALRATEEKAFLDEVCRHLVEVGGYRRAWVGLARTGNSAALHRAARAGGPDTRPTAGYPEEDRTAGKEGFWLEALRRGRTAISAGGRAVEAEVHQPGSPADSLALPLREEDRVCGVLVISAREQKTFDLEEIGFLEELAEDVVFGLVSLRTRLQRRPILPKGGAFEPVITCRGRIAHNRAEEKLRITREQLERLLSCSPAIIYSCRSGGHNGFTFISENVASFLGYEPEEFLRDPHFWLHQVHPQDRLRLMAELPSLESQGNLSMEYRFRAKDGRWHWIEDNRTLVRDAAGLPLEIIGSWIDITPRKEAEKGILEAREYAESIIETLHEPLMVLDAQLRVISANRAFYQIFQVVPHETEGRFLYELGQRQWDIPQLRELLEEIIPMNSHLQDFEVQHHFPHLGRKEMLLNARRILREGEGTQLILLAIEDVTAHKQTEENLRRSLENLQRALGETTTALASAAEIRDPYTAGHQQRVALLAGAIAREMGYSEDRQEAIRVAGILHDIGKLYVPSEILSKPTRLSDLEFAMIKTHSQVGFDILKEIRFPWPVAQIVLQHHERMNGSGYPNGLTAEAILPEARILAVADVVEAMASHRPYRPALGIKRALEEITRHRGLLYDAQVVDVCLQLFTERDFQFS